MNFLLPQPPKCSLPPSPLPAFPIAPKGGKPVKIKSLCKRFYRFSGNLLWNFSEYRLTVITNKLHILIDRLNKGRWALSVIPLDDEKSWAGALIEMSFNANTSTQYSWWVIFPLGNSFPFSVFVFWSRQKLPRYFYFDVPINGN